ncbi:MAG: hypothetical protein HYZ26_09800 [Chloroflexi bacterium]|nr:hypothetical protein [Chloroflexota bacterium]
MAKKKKPDLDKLRSQLEHELIRERRAAVEQLAGLLTDEQLRIAAFKLLEETAATNFYGIIQKAAREAMDAEQRKSMPAVAPAETMFYIGVTCSNYHTTYFDRRALCRDKTLYRRNAQVVDGRTLEEFEVVCEVCKEKMKTPPIECPEETR